MRGAALSTPPSPAVSTMAGCTSLADTICFSQDEVAAARADIDKRTEQLVSKGRWEVPGYKVRSSTETKSDNYTYVLIPITGEVRRSLAPVNYVLTWDFDPCACLDSASRRIFQRRSCGRYMQNIGKAFQQDLTYCRVIRSDVFFDCEIHDDCLLSPIRART